ncbi:MAG: hypothetical protein QOI25_3472 [Mycobacterium sp.]|jgi:hypothetical protein|nr:hypothetical protein [Mycobacterium sp.]
MARRSSGWAAKYVDSDAVTELMVAVGSAALQSSAAEAAGAAVTAGVAGASSFVPVTPLW